MAAMLPVALGCCIGVAAAQPAPSSAPSPAPRTFELPPLDDLQATRERPLFNPSRRPPEVVVAPEAPPPITESASLPFELTGIALGEDVRIAILHNKTTNEELRLHEGDKLEEWMIESVADRFILLRGDGRRVRVWLFDNAKKPGVDVRRTDGAEESSAEATPDAEVDQEVLPTSAPSSHTPTPTIPPPMTQKRVQRPPPVSRTAPMARPGPMGRTDARPQPRRN